ncbi:MAG: hypothetical protein FRX49_05777 [Trebouxia sp. A1-2]|nr:MAG: hypothetical protein FRX49_05777 [Trebouxia sp. A1-2]
MQCFRRAIFRDGSSRQPLADEYVIESRRERDVPILEALHLLGLSRPACRAFEADRRYAGNMIGRPLQSPPHSPQTPPEEPKGISNRLNANIVM